MSNTFDLDVSDSGRGTEVEDDIIFENVPFLIFASRCEASGMLGDLGRASALEHLNAPFLVENKKVNSSIFGV